MNTLIRILVGCLILGLIWFVVGLIPLASPFLLIARIVIVIIAIVWLAQSFGFVNLNKSA